MTPDAVVFDFDGVLADTEPLHLRIYETLAAEHGFPFTADEYYRRYLGFDDIGVFEALSRDKGLRIDGGRLDALIARKTRLFQDLVRETPVLFPGTAACLRALQATCPIAIASGALGHEIALILGSAGLGDLVPVVVAAGDTPQGKPAPDPYMRAMERLSLAQGRHLRPAASVAIEDSRWGLESAQKAGLLTVALTTSYPERELGHPDLVLPDIADVTPARLGTLVAAALGRAEAGA